MNRLACFAAMMVLSAPAFAGDSYFFHFRGHDIHVEAARHCRSLSCVSVSIDNGRFRSDRDDDDDDTVRDLAPAPVPSQQPSQVQSQPAPVQSVAPVMRAQTFQTPPAARLPAQAPVPIQPPPAQMQPAPPPVQAQPQPLPAPTLASTNSVLIEPPPPPPPVQPEFRAVQQPAARIEPLPDLHPRPAAVPLQAPVAEAAQRTESEDADTPLGEWQTEGKNNLVRIEACGEALCGYAYDPATGTKGETVLVNMKSKDDDQWTGTIYSHSSGNSYYSRMTLKAPNTLRVEACALGSFWCSGNNWTRVPSSAGQNEVVSSHQALPSHS